MNLMIITGRLVKDPVIRQSRKNGKTFCSMRFAIMGDYRGSNLERETDFVDMLAFGAKGQAMGLKLKKGMRLLITARLKTYEKVDAYGQRTDRFYLRVMSYEMIDSRVLKEPIEDLYDSSGELVIPKEITDSLVKQIDSTDEDLPYMEHLDDLLQNA